MDLKNHWEDVYRTRRPEEVSWFQPHARLSLELIRAGCADRDAPILDVGGGASTLVDDLLAEGYSRVTVLDLAPAALAQVRLRLGAAAAGVSLLEGDVLSVELPRASVALWHDRAVFHFLTDAADRGRYVGQVRHAVRPGGLVLLATFAADGPTRCSGLDVARYGPEELHAALGAGFQVVTSRREAHETPSGGVQAFTYLLCRFAPTDA